MKQMEKAIKNSRELDKIYGNNFNSKMSLKLEGFEIVFKANSNIILGQKLIENYIQFLLDYYDGNQYNQMVCEYLVVLFTLYF